MFQERGPCIYILSLADVNEMTVSITLFKVRPGTYQAGIVMS